MQVIALRDDGTIYKHGDPYVIRKKVDILVDITGVENVFCGDMNCLFIMNDNTICVFGDNIFEKCTIPISVGNNVVEKVFFDENFIVIITNEKNILEKDDVESVYFYENEVYALFIDGKIEIPKDVILPLSENTNIQSIKSVQNNVVIVKFDRTFILYHLPFFRKNDTDKIKEVFILL
jgi:hypothetical protein